MLPCFTDVQTAVVAKEALEGHCIYDGGFCKLHISYSRHTDLSIKVLCYKIRSSLTISLNNKEVVIGCVSKQSLLFCLGVRAFVNLCGRD